MRESRREVQVAKLTTSRERNDPVRRSGMQTTQTTGDVVFSWVRPEEACGTFFKARPAEPSGVQNAHSAEPSGVQNTYLPRDDVIHGSRTTSEEGPAEASGMRESHFAARWGKGHGKIRN